MCVYFFFNFSHCVYPSNHKILWYRTFDSLSPTFIDVLLQIVSIVNSGLGAGSLLEIYLLSWKCFQSSSSRLHPAGERSRFRILSRETTSSRQQSSAQWDVRRTNPFTPQNYLSYVVAVITKVNGFRQTLDTGNSGGLGGGRYSLPLYLHRFFSLFQKCP